MADSHNEQFIRTLQKAWRRERISRRAHGYPHGRVVECRRDREPAVSDADAQTGRVAFEVAMPRTCSII